MAFCVLTKMVINLILRVLQIDLGYLVNQQQKKIKEKQRPSKKRKQPN